MEEKKKLPLATQIFIALVLGIIAGLLLQSHADIADSYIKPIGTIFLNLLKFIVVPIVLFSITAGIITMSDIRKVGSIGIKTIVYYLCTTAVAILIGLVGGNLFKGFFPILDTSDLVFEASEATSFMDTIVGIFPSNFIAPLSEATMLQVIVMAILIGFSVILVGDEAAPAVKGINSLNAIFMKCMEMILRLSPIGVFCLICPVVASPPRTVSFSMRSVLFLCLTDASAALHPAMPPPMTMMSYFSESRRTCSIPAITVSAACSLVIAGPSQIFSVPLPIRISFTPRCPL